ncbi:MAG: PEP-CTERM sorting domain-containing protein, partial [Planctomycetota bacterium]
SVDIDAGGSTPPFDFIIVGFAGTIDNNAPLPGSGVSVLELDNIALNIIPEPGSLALVIAGGGLMTTRRRRA